MKAHFKLVSCLAGDHDLLLKVNTEDGLEESSLYDCMAPFKQLRLRRAKKKLLKKLELKSGRRYQEA